MNSDMSYQLGEMGQMMLSMIAYSFAIMRLRWYWAAKLISQFIYFSTFFFYASNDISPETLSSIVTYIVIIALGITGLFTWASTNKNSLNADGTYTTGRTPYITIRSLPVSIRIALFVGVTGLAGILYFLADRIGRFPLTEYNVLSLAAFILLVLRFWEGWVFMTILNAIWLLQAGYTTFDLYFSFTQVIHPVLDLALSIIALVTWLRVLQKQDPSVTSEQFIYAAISPGSVRAEDQRAARPQA